MSKIKKYFTFKKHLKSLQIKDPFDPKPEEEIPVSRREPFYIKPKHSNLHFLLSACRYLPKTDETYYWPEKEYGYKYRWIRNEITKEVYKKFGKIINWPEWITSIDPYDIDRIPKYLVDAFIPKYLIKKKSDKRWKPDKKEEIEADEKSSKLLIISEKDNDLCFIERENLVTKLISKKSSTPFYDNYRGSCLSQLIYSFKDVYLGVDEVESSKLRYLVPLGKILVKYIPDLFCVDSSCLYKIASKLTKEGKRKQRKIIYEWILDNWIKEEDYEKKISRWVNKQKKLDINSKIIPNLKILLKYTVNFRNLDVQLKNTLPNYNTKSSNVIKYFLYRIYNNPKFLSKENQGKIKVKKWGKIINQKYIKENQLLINFQKPNRILYLTSRLEDLVRNKKCEILDLITTIYEIPSNISKLKIEDKNKLYNNIQKFKYWVLAGNIIKYGIETYEKEEILESINYVLGEMEIPSNQKSIKNIISDSSQYFGFNIPNYLSNPYIDDVVLEKYPENSYVSFGYKYLGDIDPLVLLLVMDKKTGVLNHDISLVQKEKIVGGNNMFSLKLDKEIKKQYKYFFIYSRFKDIELSSKFISDTDLPKTLTLELFIDKPNKIPTGYKTAFLHAIYDIENQCLLYGKFNPILTSIKKFSMDGPLNIRLDKINCKTIDRYIKPLKELELPIIEQKLIKYEKLIQNG